VAEIRLPDIDSTEASQEGVPVLEVASGALDDPGPLPQPRTAPLRIAPLNTLDAVQNATKGSPSLPDVAGVGSEDAVLGSLGAMDPPTVLAALPPADPIQEKSPGPTSYEVLEACPAPDVCIDEYLWSRYEGTLKVDTAKVTERIKVTVKKGGKTRSLTKTLTKYVTQDFGWKDPAAAEKAGMSLKDFVIGGMDRGFKRKLYHALHAMDDAGLSPGLTSGFRDDYRQALASGNKAASDSSYHGGSRRGGYGYGLAADLVSAKGETRAERIKWSEILWKWIDAHEKELGVGRPYLDRDPPHVGPIDGKEFVEKRGLAKIRLLAVAKDRVATLPQDKQAMAKRGKVAKSARAAGAS